MGLGSRVHFDLVWGLYCLGVAFSKFHWKTSSRNISRVQGLFGLGLGLPLCGL